MLPEENYDDCSGQNSSTCKWMKPAKTSLGVKIRNSMAGVNLISNSNNVIRLFTSWINSLQAGFRQTLTMEKPKPPLSASYIIP